MPSGKYPEIFNKEQLTAKNFSKVTLDDPETVRQAFSRPDAQEWFVVAMLEEYGRVSTTKHGI
jgi:hypothetical protein